LQKRSNAVELNCSLNGTSRRNSSHSFSASSLHSSLKKSAQSTQQICMHT